MSPFQAHPVLTEGIICIINLEGTRCGGIDGENLKKGDGLSLNAKPGLEGLPGLCVFGMGSGAFQLRGEHEG